MGRKNAALLEASQKLYDRDELDALKQDDKCSALIDKLVGQKKSNRKERGVNPKLVWNREEAEAYKGPLLFANIEDSDIAKLSSRDLDFSPKFRITHDQIREIISFFSGSSNKDKQPGRLPYRYAWLITEGVRRRLIKDSKRAARHFNLTAEGVSTSAMQPVQIKADSRATVVGDIHGQLFDLITVLTIHGDDSLPSEKNVFVFNGDFVDRGPHGAEVLLLLFALKLYSPEGVFLNRGNHEHRRMNAKYAFEDQVLALYDSELFDLIQDAFESLSICTLINHRVLVLHGGLFSEADVSLKDIQKIRHFKQLPRHSEIEERSDRLMEQILWSDPKEDLEEGQLWRPSTRGSGVHFGPLVTQRFSELNNLDLIIRSHEECTPGYEFFHGEKLVTIFSASNYTGSTNQGAVIVFDRTKEGGKKTLVPQFKQYFANVLTSHADAAASLRDRTIQQLREQIFQYRHDLLLEFEKLDADRNDLITIDQWSEAMKKVMRMDIAWNILCPYFIKFKKQKGGEGTSKEIINYRKFIERYRISVDPAVYESLTADIVKKVTTKLFDSFPDMNEAFDQIDTNHDGSISYEEFSKVISLFNLGLAPQQVYDLMRELDDNGDGTIDRSEFEKRFGSAWKSSFQSVSDPSEKRWIAKNLRRIRKDITSHYCKKQKLTERQALKQLFSTFGGEGAKSLSVEQFSEMVERIVGEEVLSASDRIRLGNHIDSNQSGSISCRELRAVLFPAESSSPKPSLGDSLVQQLASVFYKNRVQIKSVLRMMDEDESGKVDYEEFKKGITMLNEVIGVPLTRSQARHLFKAIDQDDDKQIDYHDFVALFSVVVDSRSSSKSSSSSSSSSS